MALVRFTRHQPRIAFPALASSTLPAFDDMERRMNGLIESVLNNPFVADPYAQVIGWNPATEIVETNDELKLTAELPGIDEKDIDISVENGVLTIRGEKTEERKEESKNGDMEKKIYLYERSYGSFERSFTLPLSLDSSKITANFDKGILTIRMPKIPEAKASAHKIAITKN